MKLGTSRAQKVLFLIGLGLLTPLSGWSVNLATLFRISGRTGIWRDLIQTSDGRSVALRNPWNGLAALPQLREMRRHGNYGAQTAPYPCHPQILRFGRTQDCPGDWSSTYLQYLFAMPDGNTFIPSQGTIHNPINSITPEQIGRLELKIATIDREKLKNLEYFLQVRNDIMEIIEHPDDPTKDKKHKTLAPSALDETSLAQLLPEPKDRKGITAPFLFQKNYPQGCEGPEDFFQKFHDLSKRLSVFIPTPSTDRANQGSQSIRGNYDIFLSRSAAEDFANALLGTLLESTLRPRKYSPHLAEDALYLYFLMKYKERGDVLRLFRYAPELVKDGPNRWWSPTLSGQDQSEKTAWMKAAQPEPEASSGKSPLQLTYESWKSSLNQQAVQIGIEEPLTVATELNDLEKFYQDHQEWRKNPAEWEREWIKKQKKYYSSDDKWHEESKKKNPKYLRRILAFRWIDSLSPKVKELIHDPERMEMLLYWANQLDRSTPPDLMPSTAVVPSRDPGGPSISHSNCGEALALSFLGAPFYDSKTLQYKPEILEATIKRFKLRPYTRNVAEMPLGVLHHYFKHHPSILERSSQTAQNAWSAEVIARLNDDPANRDPLRPAMDWKRLNKKIFYIKPTSALETPEGPYCELYEGGLDTFLNVVERLLGDYEDEHSDPESPGEKNLLSLGTLSLQQAAEIAALGPTALPSQISEVEGRFRKEKLNRICKLLSRPEFPVKWYAPNAARDEIQQETGKSVRIMLPGTTLQLDFEKNQYELHYGVEPEASIPNNWVHRLSYTFVEQIFRHRQDPSVDPAALGWILTRQYPMDDPHLAALVRENPDLIYSFPWDHDFQVTRKIHFILENRLVDLYPDALRWISSLAPKEVQFMEEHMDLDALGGLLDDFLNKKDLDVKTLTFLKEAAARLNHPMISISDRSDRTFRRHLFRELWNQGKFTPDAILDQSEGKNLIEILASFGLKDELDLVLNHLRSASRLKPTSGQDPFGQVLLETLYTNRPSRHSKSKEKSHLERVQNGFYRQGEILRSLLTDPDFHPDSLRAFEVVRQTKNGVIYRASDQESAEVFELIRQVAFKKGPIEGQKLLDEICHLFPQDASKVIDTPLHQAAAQKDPAILKGLIGLCRYQNGEWKILDAHGRSPLEWAAVQANEDTLKVLLDHGYFEKEDFLREDQFKQNAVYYLVSYRMGDLLKQALFKGWITSTDVTEAAKKVKEKEDHTRRVSRSAPDLDAKAPLTDFLQGLL